MQFGLSFASTLWIEKSKVIHSSFNGQCHPSTYREPPVQNSRGDTRPAHSCAECHYDIDTLNANEEFERTIDYLGHCSGCSFGCNCIDHGSRSQRSALGSDLRKTRQQGTGNGGTQTRELVYDLGSGDGRLVISATRDFGARAVGVEIDPFRGTLLTLENIAAPATG